MSAIYVIIASVLFGIFPTLQDHVLQTGVTPLGIVLSCNSIACIFSLLIARRSGLSLQVTHNQLFHLGLIGVLGLLITDLLKTVAYTMIPVGYVVMIHFMYPALVCVAGGVIFKEKIRTTNILAILSSLTGMAMLTGSGFSGNPAGIFVAFLTAVSYVYYMMACERTSVAKLAPIIRVFYTNLFVVMAVAPVAFVRGAVLPHGMFNWGCCLLVGAMLCGGAMFLNMGIHHLGAGKAAFINMLEPVTSMLISVVFLGVSLTFSAVLGCLLIMGSLCFNSMGSKELPAGQARPELRSHENRT